MASMYFQSDYMTMTIARRSAEATSSQASNSEVTTTTSESTSGTTSSFIGNTPSTVLFFIALAVGVCIAILFIYFTLRYFVKTKYGVYIPTHSPNGRPLGAPLPTMGATSRYGFATHNTFNNINDFAEYALHRDYNALLAVRERRLARRRYRKKRKLTKDEVDQLFPIKTYHDWENGGKEDDVERHRGLILDENEAEDANRLQQEAEQEVIEQQQAIAPTSSHPHGTETDITELQDLSTASNNKASVSVEEHAMNATAQQNTAAEVDLTEDLHFSSGMCAICLDNLDDEDQVRGLVCGHVFHQECIDPWLINRKACCPMCKRDYYMKDGSNGEDAEENDEIDGGSLMPLDSFADLILPRPISYRARELLDALDAHQNNGTTSDHPGATSTQEGANDAADTNIHDAQVDDHPNGISVQDLVGIREAAAAELPNFYGVFKRFFWRVMGVTRESLYDYLIVKIYEERRGQRLSRENADATAASEQQTQVPTRADDELNVVNMRANVQYMA